MKFAMLLFLASCATSPVTYEHWHECEKGCGFRAVKEACVTIRGQACECFDGFTFWIDDEAVEDLTDEINIMGGY